MKKIFLTIICLMFSLASMNAQFSVNGNESTFVKWNTFNTDSYQFIYPSGCDSLAKAYAVQWEKYKLSVGYDRATRHPLPVVLHPYTSTSNGFVVWTPSRMEMFAAPSMYSPEPIPWHTLLAIHENRHVSQMQFLYRSPFWIFNVFGELLAGPLCLLYSTSMFMEGDAVATETALSQSGRGRSADFLEYFRASFEEGDTRNIYRWRYGSQKLYTPDYYKIGYLAAGGMNIGSHDEFFCNTLREKFDDFAAGLQKEWMDDTANRAPFQNYSQLTEDEAYYLSYSGLTQMDGKIYAVQSGMAQNATLVSFDIQNGFKKKTLRHTSAESALKAYGGKLYWSEEISNLRWEMQSISAIRSYEDGKIRTELGGKRLFNPALQDGKLAVIENLPEGAVAARVYEKENKFILSDSYFAPDGLQLLEPVWVEGHLYASAGSADGQGIYDVQDGFKVVLEPSPVKINHLFSDNGRICFTSDRTGVNELYALDVQSGEVCQLTNLPRGGKDFVFAGDSLYFTMLSVWGRNIYVSTREELPVKKVDFTQRHAYALADSLSASVEVEPLKEEYISLGNVKRYSKIRNAFRFHSWAPIYSEIDDIQTISYSSTREDLGVGATAYFQNNLSTLYGNVGMGIMSAEDHFVGKTSVNMTYRGLYPVFQVKASASTALYTHGDTSYDDTYDVLLRAYIPFNLSRNGWSAGVIPYVTYEDVPLVGRIAYGLTAYKVLPTTKSAIFPKLGIGASIVGSNYISINDDINKINYPSATVYGYLPGFFKTHSISLRTTYSREVASKENSYRSDKFTASIQYGIPLWSIDCAKFSPLTYIKNFEIIPFYEYNQIKLSDTECWSVFGSYFDVVISNFWFFPTDMHPGVKVGYNTQTNKVECQAVFTYDL